MSRQTISKKIGFSCPLADIVRSFTDGSFVPNLLFELVFNKENAPLGHTGQ